jgi:SAM-dependent methyltransferase
MDELNSTDGFFDSEYLHLYEPRLTLERTQREVDFLVNKVFDESTRAVLDLPCGYGRHSAALAAKGYLVTGVDLSKTMIEESKKRKTVDNSKLIYTLGDMRTFKSSDKFDAAICMFSSFGYFKKYSDNVEVIKNFSRNLKKGGLLVIDVRNPIRDIVEFSKTNWHQVENIKGIKINQTLDPLLLRHRITYSYGAGGESREKSASWTHYLFPELKNILEHANFSIIKTFGNFEADAYSPESSRLIIVAELN